MIELEKPRIVVGVGASAGGLEPCKQLFASVPADSGLAFVVVLHLDPSRISHLAEVLAADSTLPVVPVTEPQLIARNHVYVIAPNTSLEIIDGELRTGALAERKGTGSGVIDVLFSSLARAYGSGAVAIVLSGLGNDGTAGLAEVKDAGGLCIAQDPLTAEHPTMPRSAIASGKVEAILRPDTIAAFLLEHAQLRRANSEEPELPALASASEADFEAVLRLLGMHHGFDPRDYKRGSLRRPAQRRLEALSIDGWGDYLRYVTEHPEELAVLYDHVLIGVTQFFRDPEQWEYLEREVVPQLLGAHREPQDAIRVWSAGCATGEEAYSLAIVLLEALEARGSHAKLQVFATDVSQSAIAFARHGLYPASIAQHVSPERLAQFFVEQDGSYQVQGRVRDAVTLAQHDLLTQPPFSRVDLIVCRNLFIYLEAHAQRACIERFHFALWPHGVLWLGNSESVNRHGDLFTVLAAEFRMYRKCEVPRAATASWSLRLSAPSELVVAIPNRTTGDARDGARLTRALETHVLQHYSSACAVINEAGHVLHFFGPIGDYLSLPNGEVRMDFLAWVHEAPLYAKLRPALKRAIEQREATRIGGVQLLRGSKLIGVEVRIEPLSAIDESLFIVVFSDERPSPEMELGSLTAAGASDGLVRRLTTQLEEVQAELRGTLQELDSTTEEYRASYEELVSLNEELQSSNEELETTKEEAQSLNQELLTVNRELEERNDRLRTVNADLENLLTLTTIPVVFLDRQFRVRRFTPAADRVMWLVPADVGRPIQHIQKRVQDERLLSDAARVQEELLAIEAEVRTEEGRWYLRKIVPFRSGDRIDGVCVIYYDITAQKLAAVESEEARYFAEALVRSSRLPFVVFDRELNAVSANEVFYENFASSRDQLEGKSLATMCGGCWNLPAVRELLERVVYDRPGARDLELDGEFARAGFRHLRFYASLLERPARAPLLLLKIEDVTQLREAQATASKRTRELELEHRRKDEFLAMLGHELRNPLATVVHGLALLDRTGGGPEQFDKVLPVLVRQTRRMTVMLDQLLEVAHISAGKILLDEQIVDLVDVVNAATEAVQSMIDAAGHKLVQTLPEPGRVFVRGDLVRLIQIVENLLSNAAKYTNDRGTIWQSIEADESTARIIVRDNGLGIEPDLLTGIFDMFTQSQQSIARAKGGLGLGLGLVRLLVHMHGGRVEAFSEGPGLGSKFVVHLPRVAVQVVPQRSSPGAQLEAVAARRVLVVDDQQDVAVSLAELLRSYGHQTRVAHDGPSALEAVQSFAPEVVLLDLGLEGTDGYVLAKQLRAQQPDLRIIAVTGYQRDDQRLREAGFDDHVLKPASLDRLARVLSGE
jgi:two-component system CheB/CheR fusion protein